MKTAQFWRISLASLALIGSAVGQTTNLVSNAGVTNTITGANRFLMTIGNVGATNVLRQIAASNAIASLGLATTASLTNLSNSLAGLTTNNLTGTNAVFMWDPLESTCRHASLSIL